MTRARLAGLLVVLLALAGALVYGLEGKGSPSKQAAVDLEPYRIAAALAACPSGISPALPAVTLPCLGGGPDVMLRSAATGKPTLLNLYGSWCPPCAREMPLLARFSRAAGDRVSLVGVDTEDDPRLALIFAKQVGQTWPAVVDDDKKVLLQFGGNPPVTVFIDPVGKVLYAHFGEYTSDTLLRSDVKKYLGVRV